jgi:hypothetical protein
MSAGLVCVSNPSAGSGPYPLCMAGITNDEIAAMIRDAAARIEAPERLRRRLPPPPSRWPLALRALGALATLAVGAVHLQQYVKLYSTVPTIGTLFVLNFAGATVLGLALLSPIERLAPLLAAAAIGLAATSFVFLLISEHTPLFGFQEPGYDPAGIAAARISEIATVVLLGAYLVARTTQNRRPS